MRLLIGILALTFCMAGCREIELYERLRNINNSEWSGEDTLRYSFEIRDTLAAYNVFLVVRHTNLYPYRNIFLNVGLQQPGDSMRNQRFEVQLAASDRWLGVGMDDIYEHRAKMFDQPVHFSRPGIITFTLQHLMRQDPLPGMLQAGIRVEPAPAVGVKGD